MHAPRRRGERPVGKPVLLGQDDHFDRGRLGVGPRDAQPAARGGIVAGHKHAFERRQRWRLTRRP
jgi:hypothetical protein